MSVYRRCRCVAAAVVHDSVGACRCGSGIACAAAIVHDSIGACRCGSVMRCADRGQARRRNVTWVIVAPSQPASGGRPLVHVVRRQDMLLATAGGWLGFRPGDASAASLCLSGPPHNSV